jgi:hypothetical protein
VKNPLPGIAAILFATAAACGQSREEPAAPTAAAAAEAPATPRGKLPPLDSHARYVGVWAAAETACGHEAWRLSTDRLEGPAFMACDFQQVTPEQGEYSIAAKCTDGANENAANIRLSFAESAQAMLMQGVPGTADVGLVYCGPLNG